MCAHVYVLECHRTFVEVRGRLLGVACSPSIVWVLGQMPFLAELSPSQQYCVSTTSSYNPFALLNY